VRTPENKDKKNDNFIKCKYVKCKISHINSSRYVEIFWIEDYSMPIFSPKSVPVGCFICFGGTHLKFFSQQVKLHPYTC